MREVRRPDPPQPVFFDLDTVTLEPRRETVRAARVPSHDDVRQKRVHAANHVNPDSLGDDNFYKFT